MRHIERLLYLVPIVIALVPRAVDATGHNTAFLTPNTNMIRVGVLTTRSLTNLRRIATVRRCTRKVAAVDRSQPRPIETVAIVGGGLAGLSTAYHLLVKGKETGCVPRITVIDKEEVGCGGASAVAGGLLHPFSPRGKVVYLGLEGLASTNSLLLRALRHEPNCVVRDRLYRIAMDDKYATQLRQTADLNPGHAAWLEPSAIEESCGTTGSTGGLVLSNGCKVINVPLYLHGLWKACGDLSGGMATWCTERGSGMDWKERLEEYDAVVLSAGAGLIRDAVLSSHAMSDVPATLVRGQSIEMMLTNSPDSTPIPNQAVLCGKYAAPLSLDAPDRVLIGATHEFGEKMTREEVYDELRGRSIDFLPQVWDRGVVEKVTCGERVQSQRGAKGRLPILGKVEGRRLHDNAWLFTGLSSRGLIHHGVCGDILSDAILDDDEGVVAREYPELLWWK